MIVKLQTIYMFVKHHMYNEMLNQISNLFINVASPIKGSSV